MRWKKGHFWVSVAAFLPIILTLVYFYASSNKNLKFVFEAKRIVFVDLDPEYDVEQDSHNLISINQEESLITFNYHKIMYNELLIENGEITMPLDNEYLIHGKFYEVNKDFKLQKINASNKLKESLTENTIIIGLSVIIIIFAGVIAAYMIAKQMDVMKRYRRYSIVISLLVLTIIMLMLSMITTQLFLGFAAAFIGWSMYTISWTVKRKLNGLPIYEDQRVRVVVEND